MGIDWDYVKKRDFIRALSTYFGRFPKPKVKRKTSRPTPLYKFTQDENSND